MNFIDARLSSRNRDQQQSNTDDADHWRQLGPIVRRIVDRLHVPTPTAIVIAEAAGLRVEEAD